MHILVKLMKRFQWDAQTYESLFGIFSKSAAFNVSGTNLKEYIGQIRSIKDKGKRNFAYIERVLTSLLEMITLRSENELFIFPGDACSGLIIEPKKGFPKEGYSFFCWIRAEFPTPIDKKMTIFSFNSSNNNRKVDFYLSHNILNYAVSHLKIT